MIRERQKLPYDGLDENSPLISFLYIIKVLFNVLYLRYYNTLILFLATIGDGREEEEDKGSITLLF